MSNKHYLSRCPHCNYLATDHETLEGEKKYRLGDISFCIACGEISKFVENGRVKITMDSLDKGTKKEIRKIESAWLQTRTLVGKN